MLVGRWIVDLVLLDVREEGSDPVLLKETHERRL